VTPLIVALTVVVALEVVGILVYASYRLGGRSTEAPPVVAPLTNAEDPRTAPDWYRDLVMEVIIVHMKSGISFEGLCVLVWETGLMLRNPKLLDEKRSPTPMAGELRIGEDKIDSIQTKPAELEELPAP
jgi:hypothetical protein